MGKGIDADGIQRVALSTGTDDFKIDRASGSISIVEFAHHEAHDGDAYKVTTSGIDVRDTILILTFTTPNSEKWLHCLFFAASTGGATFTLTEGGAFGGSGSVNVPVICRNRNTGNTSTILAELSGTAGSVTTDATPTGGGTVLVSESIGAGKDKSPGVSRDDGELILKQNTRYEAKLVGLADNVVGSITMSWYEHTDNRAA